MPSSLRPPVGARLLALIWLLVLLIPVQGVMAATLLAAGPTHTHSKASQTAALTDFRRLAPAPPPEAAMPTTFGGHSHHADASERHHHASDDASVLRSSDDASLDRQAATERPSPGLQLLVALLPSSLVSEQQDRPTTWEQAPHRELAAASPDPFDRPPKRLS